jgi:hypothetical protein
MKRRDLIRYLIQHGCELDREGKRIPSTGGQKPTAAQP